nr:NADH dehydrogenase subunit 6 [Eumenotes sp. HEM140]
MNMLLTFMTSLSMLMLWMKHPLSMGIILMCQTLMIAMIMGKLMGSFMFSYIIMIIMMSGALVLFIYMASVASNEKFKMSFMLMIIFMMINIIFYMMLNSTNTYEPLNNLIIINKENLSLIKIYNSMSAYITIMMMIYLLLTMIIVPNIAKTSEGALKMKM